jgi:hypothetical protein
MSCAITSGRTLPCREGQGGISEVYFTELANKDSITTVDGAITAFTLTSGKKFFRYDLVKKTSSFEETIKANVENGTLAYEQMLNLIFNKGETSTRNQIRLLAQNVLLCIVKDKNNKYWLMGEENGVDLTEGKFSSGVNGEDRNGYELTFMGEEREGMKEVTSSLIAALIV